MKYIMGIDCGGTVVKASIFDLDGREMSSCGEKMDVIAPQADWFERDTAQTKACAFKAISGAIKKAGVDGADIAGIGVTGQANGLYMFKKTALQPTTVFSAQTPELKTILKSGRRTVPRTGSYQSSRKPSGPVSCLYSCPGLRSIILSLLTSAMSALLQRIISASC